MELNITVVKQKKPWNGLYTSIVFVYHTNTRMSKIWYDIFSPCHLLVIFCIPSIYQLYQIIYQVDNLKNAWTNSFTKFKFKPKKFMGPFVVFFLHSSNIKNLFYWIFRFNLELLWICCFSFLYHTGSAPWVWGFSTETTIQQLFVFCL